MRFPLVSNVQKPVSVWRITRGLQLKNQRPIALHDFSIARVLFLAKSP
ncbi:hypothetical protein [Microcoleus sp. bin38.metabat.b11b12b14.051]|nr:hypothetical protein [Microcoleus sp. bin38.metabat.b11b12b14.051]